MDFRVPCRNGRCGFRVPANWCVASSRLLFRDLACAHRRVECMACFPTLSLILESGAGEVDAFPEPVNLLDQRRFENVARGSCRCSRRQRPSRPCRNWLGLGQLAVGGRDRPLRPSGSARHRRTRLHGTRQTRRRAAFSGVDRTGGKELRRHRLQRVVLRLDDNVHRPTTLRRHRGSAHLAAATSSKPPPTLTDSSTSELSNPLDTHTRWVRITPYRT